MIRYFSRTISLNNLFNASSSGQIATMLMLFMVVILLFILTTVNLGSVSIKTTTISNAADTAALLLASRLASRSNQMFDAIIPEKEKASYANDHNKVVKSCVKSGILPGVAAAIVVAATLLPLIFISGGLAAIPFWQILVGSIIKGAYVGALVGHFSGLGAGTGAMQGAIVGASIAGGFGAFGVTQIAAGTLMVSSSTGAVIGITSSAAIYVSLAGAIVGSIIGAATSLYGQAVREAPIADRVIKQIENIEDDYIRMREEVMHAALSLVVDDPNKLPDIYDLNSNGDTGDFISAFDQLYYERVRDLQVYPNLKLIKDFLNDLRGFVGEKGFIPRPEDSLARGFLRWLHRNEVECSVCNCPGASCNESPTVELFRGLKACEYKIDFWKPGPDRDALFKETPNGSPTGWYLCNDCNPPSGFDSLDSIHKQMENFIDSAADFIKKDPKDLDRDHSWVYTFYIPDAPPPPPPNPDCAGSSDPYCSSDIPPLDNPQDPGSQPKTDYYHILGAIVNGDPGLTGGFGLNDWISRLEGLPGQMPKCQISYGEYTPNITQEDDDQPCGKPYNAKYVYYSQLGPEGIAQLEEGEQAEAKEVLATDSAFYPCSWKKYPGENKEQTDAYFHNPACKVNLNDRAGYLNQVTTIENVVNGLQEKLTAKATAAVQASCQANCPPGSRCFCWHSGLAVNIDKLSLDNPGSQGSCSRTENSQESVLSYHYYYNYNCTRCCPQLFCFTDPFTGQRICFEIWICNSTCPAGPSCRAEESDKKPLPGVTDIVHIPETSGGDAVGKFLDMVGKVGSFAGDIAIEGMYSFVTIDADIEDELNPVRKNLKIYRDSLEGMRAKISNFYYALKAQDQAENRPKDGSGDLSYSWDDTQGNHFVWVKVGPFKLPKYVFRTNKFISEVLLKNTCTYIEPIDDITGDRTWVRIIRGDPPGTPGLNLQSGKSSLGRWNPVLGSAKPEFTIIRRTSAYYSWDKVGIAKRENK
ncbi:MAG: MgtC/SapB family protein [Candidatus Omnitrophica bacterium]|nr:MgtC/SapB family protein [Candidatus Omnitrophota bacterium]